MAAITWSTWAKSWGSSWASTWGPIGGQDTHDGAGSEYWYQYWRKLHKKKKTEPTLADIVEAVQELPRMAVKAVPQAKTKFPDIDYAGIRNNAVMAEFLARQILIQIEMKRIEDENDENDAIMLLLM